MPTPILMATIAPNTLSDGLAAEASLAALPNGSFALAVSQEDAGGLRRPEIRLVTGDSEDWDLYSLLYAIPGSITERAAQPGLAALPDGRLFSMWVERPLTDAINYWVHGLLTYGDGDLDADLGQVIYGLGQHDAVVAVTPQSVIVVATISFDGRIFTDALRQSGAVLTGALDLTGSHPANISSPATGAQDLGMAINDDGLGYLVWKGQDGGLYGRGIGSYGGARTAEQTLQAPGGPAFTDVEVAALPDDTFLVTVERLQVAVGMVLDIDGGLLRSFTLAAAPVGHLYRNFDTTVLSDGRILITYADTTTGATFTTRVMGQLLSSTGVPDGAAFAITASRTTPGQEASAVELTDGRIAIAVAGVVGGINLPVEVSLWDPRNAGLNRSATGLNDSWEGTRLADQMRMEAGADRALGGAGNDILTGGKGYDYLAGGQDDDALYGGSASDSLYGGSGQDSVFGGSGGDVIEAGSGGDSLSGGAGNDTLTGGAGADAIDGGAGIDTADYATSGTGVTLRLWNGTGAGGDAAGDTLSGIENLTGSGAGDGLVGSDGVANTLIGGAGGDFLDGMSGEDRLDGGTGNDVLRGGAGADALLGGADVDTADYATSASGVTVRLSTGTGQNGDAQGDVLTGVENLTGSAFGDGLVGSDEAGNTLRGGAGNDYLAGLLGADVLDGGTGNDTLAGGANADVFVFGAGYGHDRVISFDDGFDRGDLVGVTFAQFTETAIFGGVRLTGPGGIILDLLGGITTAQVTAADFF